MSFLRVRRVFLQIIIEYLHLNHVIIRFRLNYCCLFYCYDSSKNSWACALFSLVTCCYLTENLGARMFITSPTDEFYENHINLPA